MSDAAPCAHVRRRLIAEDEYETHFECVDCGALFEAGEAPKESAARAETLGDA
jgi:hypothetical protein